VLEAVERFFERQPAAGEQREAASEKGDPAHAQSRGYEAEVRT
jgi:hypothetical protein